MTSKFLGIFLLGLFAVGAVLGQNEEIPVENDNQFPPETANKIDESLMSNDKSTTPTAEDDVFLPGMLAIELESDFTTDNTAQEQETSYTTIASNTYEGNETIPVTDSTPQEEKVETTNITETDETETSYTEIGTENTTSTIENIEADVNGLLDEATTTILETTFTAEENTIDTQQETTSTPAFKEQETITTPISDQETGGFGVISDGLFINTSQEKETSTTQSDPSLIGGIFNIFMSRVMSKNEPDTEIRTNKLEESSQTAIPEVNGNLQKMIISNTQETVDQSATVESPKGELVKDTAATTNTGGVDKSIIGIVVAAMIVIVAVIVIKKNWTSIRKRFSSTPNRAHNDYTAVKTNGTAADDIPMQDNEKSPV